MIKKAIYSVGMCAIVGAAFVAGSLHNSSAAVTAAGVDPRRPLYYRCPMHPTYTSDKPGISPDCGMELEPVYADTALAAAGTGDSPLSAGAVVVSPHQQQLTGVRVAAAETAAGTERVRLYGRVTPEETNVYKLNVGLDGYVRDVAPVTAGSQVRKDQWLATYSTPESRQPIGAYVQSLDVLDREIKLGSSPQQIAAAVSNKRVATDRLLTAGMSAVQLEEMAKTRAVAENIHVASPVDGFILSRNVSIGEKFERGAEFFRIADLRRVAILADVPAGSAPHLASRTIVQIIVPGRTAPLPARVSARLLPQFDPSTQSMKIRLEADNPGFVLRPDMFVDVELQVPYAATLTVPGEAVVRSGLRSTVFVERSAGVFEPREVKTGRRLADRVQILEGLAPGERLAVSGTFLLDSESRMRVR
jgi:Cu(I)/Ag(I) efflux system membrane fusion protein